MPDPCFDESDWGNFFNLGGIGACGAGQEGFWGRAVLLEAGAAIIFFGSLIQQPEIAEYGARALQELSVRGYEIPTAAEPVRAYPATTSGSFSASHAGGWRPGVISLRENPQGSAGTEVYLRHELMHEASFRTCKGKLPLWAEEAAAISFAMESTPPPFSKGGPGGILSPSATYPGTAVGEELSGPSCASQPTDRELENLRKRVRVGASLDQENYRVLAALVSCLWLALETLRPLGSHRETAYATSTTWRNGFQLSPGEPHFREDPGIPGGSQ